MFEWFTDRAQKVMAMANQAAQELGHEYIGTEHILLGLVKEGTGVGANVLKNLDVDLKKVRLEVSKLVKCGPVMGATGKQPQTPRAKKVIEYAIAEAQGLGQNYVGTEHMLLGLLREQDGVAATVLTNLGLKVEAVREEVLSLLGASPKGSSERDSRIALGSTEVVSGLDARIELELQFGMAITMLRSAARLAFNERKDELASRLSDEAKRLKAMFADIQGGPGEPESPTHSPDEGTRVQCPDSSCGHHNEPGARFCSRCGRRLAGE